MGLYTGYIGTHSKKMAALELMDASGVQGCTNRTDFERFKTGMGMAYWIDENVIHFFSFHSLPKLEGKLMRICLS